MDPVRARWELLRPTTCVLLGDVHHPLRRFKDHLAEMEVTVIRAKARFLCSTAGPSADLSRWPSIEESICSQ